MHKEDIFIVNIYHGLILLFYIYHQTKNEEDN